MMRVRVAECGAPAAAPEAGAACGGSGCCGCSRGCSAAVRPLVRASGGGGGDGAYTGSGLNCGERACCCCASDSDGAGGGGGGGGSVAGGGCCCCCCCCGCLLLKVFQLLSWCRRESLALGSGRYDEVSPAARGCNGSSEPVAAANSVNIMFSWKPAADACRLEAADQTNGGGRGSAAVPAVGAAATEASKLTAARMARASQTRSRLPRSSVWFCFDAPSRSGSGGELGDFSGSCADTRYPKELHVPSSVRLAEVRQLSCSGLRLCRSPVP